jgi:hypothetical protein
VELPDGSNAAFLRGVMRTFVAKFLMDAGCVSASETVIDVLSDVMEKNSLEQLQQFNRELEKASLIASCMQLRSLAFLFDS